MKSNLFTPIYVNGKIMWNRFIIIIEKLAKIYNVVTLTTATLQPFTLNDSVYWRVQHSENTILFAFIINTSIRTIYCCDWLPQIFISTGWINAKQQQNSTVGEWMNCIQGDFFPSQYCWYYYSLKQFP